jgi:hypothetical protein
MKTIVKTTFFFAVCASLMLVGASSLLKAQSLEFTKTPSGPVSFASLEEIAEIGLRIKNVSNAPVKVWVTMDTAGCAPGHRSYFCWEQCYTFGVTDPRQIPTGKPITLRPGQDTNAFKAYVDAMAVNPNGVSGKTILKFDFFNEEDPSDRISIDLTFLIGSVQSTGMEQITRPAGIQFVPAQNILQYQGNGTPRQLELFSVTGSAFIPPSGDNGNYSAAGLVNGIYGFRIIQEDGSESRGILNISR